jgi:hypothetical protein
MRPAFLYLQTIKVDRRRAVSLEAFWGSVFADSIAA